MSHSPQDPQAAYLLSMLHELEQRAPASGAVEPGTEAAARDFLLTLEEDPSTTPQTPRQRGTALVLAWSRASVCGKPEQAKAIAKEIEQEAASNPFPFRQVLQAHRDTDFVNALGSTPSHYRSHGGDLSFGMIPGKLPDDAKIGILGDWGTGQTDAAYLLDCMLTQHPGLAAILHLGDIYDAGTLNEAKERFVHPLRQALAQHKLQIPVFAVPGDHEYFTHGAAGFFWMLQNVNSWDSQWLQQASYFCLRTQGGAWQILGADTGYAKPSVQPGLQASEKDWHQDKVDNFSGKTVFLTHRQFVSAYDSLDGASYNNALVRDMKDLMPKIDLMLWGHEHRFVPYIDQLAVPTYSGSLKTKLRTLGGSARHTREQLPANTAVVRPAANNTYFWTGFANGLCNHSYAVLDLGAATASYFQVSAWMRDAQNPVKSAPSQAVLIDKL